MSSNEESETNVNNTFIEKRIAERKQEIRTKQQQISDMKKALSIHLNNKSQPDAELITYQFIEEREKVFDEILKIDDLLDNPNNQKSKYDQLKNIIEMLKKTIEALQTQNDMQKKIIDLLSDELEKKNG